jgi:Contractile injection system tube protein/LysM domain
MSLGLDDAVGIGLGMAAMAGARVPATLRCLTPPHLGVVPFDFNPNSIKMTRSGRYDTKASSSSSTGAHPPQPKVVKGSKITLDKLLIQGELTKVLCDTLLTWMTPGTGGLMGMISSAVAGALGANLRSEPPDLTFQWGPPMIGFMYTVKLTSCSVKYNRFTPEGIPIRAEVNIGMDEVPSLLGSLPMNPTSGGIPGRRSHTVGQGESLQSIATANYGQPGLWRRIAEVNGITDPTRVRPGSTVYLPNPDELTSGSTR